jgi:hypothetical protein
MKLLFIIPLVFLTACASRPTVVKMPAAVPGTVMPSEGAESVRYSENIKAYPVGRYVDPNNSFVMHERHTVYRVETTAKWNLHPNGPASIPLGPPLGIIDAAKYGAPVSAEVLAEVNKQKATTQALLDQGTRIDKAFSQLSGAFQGTRLVSEQNLQLKRELTTTEKRLDALERQLRNRETNAPVSARQNTNNEW